MNEEPNKNWELNPMGFDPRNPFFAQLFRCRFENLTSEREKERDFLINTRSSNFLFGRYPPYGMFRAADELTKEKLALEDLDNFVKKNDSNDIDSLNIIRLSQTADILNSVLKESDEKLEKIKSINDQFMKLEKKQDS